MEKLTEKQTEVETVMSEVSGFPVPQLDPRVLEVYRGVREVRAERKAIIQYPRRGCGLPPKALGAHISQTNNAEIRLKSPSAWVQIPALPA